MQHSSTRRQTYSMQCPQRSHLYLPPPATTVYYNRQPRCRCARVHMPTHGEGAVAASTPRSSNTGMVYGLCVALPAAQPGNGCQRKHSHRRARVGMCSAAPSAAPCCCDNACAPTQQMYTCTAHPRLGFSRLAQLGSLDTPALPAITTKALLLLLIRALHRSSWTELLRVC